MNDDSATAGSAPGGFGAAMAELEEILAALEEDRVGVDDLAASVRRAGELVQYCRDRISRTRVEIEQIVADLDPGTTED